MLCSSCGFDDTEGIKFCDEIDVLVYFGYPRAHEDAAERGHPSKPKHEYVRPSQVTAGIS